jgi:hypothetical protein
MLLSLLSLVMGVLGNAEKIIVHENHFRVGHFLPNDTLQLALPYEVSKPIAMNIPATYGAKLSPQFIQIDGIDGSPFEVRVCWPASHPVDFTLRDCENCQSPTVIVEGTYAGVSIHTQMETIQFYLVAEELILGAIPRSTIPAILMAILWACIGGIFTNYFIQQMNSNTSTINQQKSK